MKKPLDPVPVQRVIMAHMCKRSHNDKLAVSALVLLPSLLYMPPAYAYIDPGAGSILLQSLLAGLATVAAVASVFWQRLKAIVSTRFSNRKSTENRPEDNADKS